MKITIETVAEYHKRCDHSLRFHHPHRVKCIYTNSAGLRKIGYVVTIDSASYFWAEWDLACEFIYQMTNGHIEPKAFANRFTGMHYSHVHWCDPI